MYPCTGQKEESGNPFAPGTESTRQDKAGVFQTRMPWVSYPLQWATGGSTIALRCFWRLEDACTVLPGVFNSRAAVRIRADRSRSTPDTRCCDSAPGCRDPGERAIPLAGADGRQGAAGGWSCQGVPRGYAPLPRYETP